ncbi:hypothetical protein N5C81_22935 [Rhizobium pusense]|uniref:hypothetical protein n=1 Tax=Agrobacterium pusense TaxID=648995 RepID=UPI00244C2A93|nr:hypothetical protein [Agrobacterium pusense]MDH1270474.1 hypothetical protein [Agrobacterium pusense]
MTEIFQYIEALPIITQFRGSVWAYPIISWTHVLGISILFGSIFCADLGLLGVAPQLGERTVQSTLSKIGIFGFCVTIISGTVLLAPAIREYLSNGYFAIKMIVILLAGINALVLYGVFHGARSTSKLAAVSGGLSIMLWLIVMFCGRMLAFG